MSISDNYAPLRQLGNGSTTAFSPMWTALNTSFIKVFFENVVTGVQTPQMSGFTITLNTVGFTVNFTVAPPSSVYVVIARQVPRDQGFDYSTAQGFNGPQITKSFDKLTAITQDLQEIQDRTLTVPLGSPVTQITIEPPIPGKGLRWDDAGTGIVNTMDDLDDLASIATTQAAIAVAAASAAAASAAAISLPLPITSGGTAGTTLAAARTNLSINAARNFIVNGGFDVLQEFGSTGIGFANTRVYNADMWFMQQSGTPSVIGFTLVGSGYGGVPGISNLLRAQRSTSPTGIPILGQVIESADAVGLAGQQVTVSFWARKGNNFSSAGSALGLVFYGGAGIDQSATGMLTGSWTNQTNISDASHVLTTSWVRYTRTFTIPANLGGSALSQVGFYFSYQPVGAPGPADFFDVTGVQLEIGPSASSWITEPFHQILQKCQRHWCKTFPYATPPANAAGLNGSIEFGAIGTVPGDAVLLNWDYPVTMRASPTIVSYNPVSANALIRNLTNGTDLGGGVQRASDKRASFSNASTAVANSHYAIHLTANSRL